MNDGASKSGYFLVEPCNSSGGFEIKLRAGKLDLAKCEQVLGAIGSVAGSTGIVLLAKVDRFALSLYGSGRIMVKSATRGKKPTRAEVEKMADRLMNELEKAGAVVR